jgi:alanyl-tRNA synthetase
LGETATQAGSENAPGRFRFDFPSAAAVPVGVLNDVESRVNELLIGDLQVHAEVMSQDAARAMGAMALFGEKYGGQVRVVSVGDWAKELCGGTHVTRSGQIGVVKLLSESSIGAGVRRVEALVGHDAYQYLAREHLLLNSLTEIIKGVRSEELPQRISEMIEKMKAMEKVISSARSAKAMAGAANLLKRVRALNGVNLIVEQLADEISVEDMRSITLDLASKIKDGVVVLATVVSAKPLIVASVSPEAIKLGIKAGEIIKIGSTILGGGGGGKDDFAQGGGTESGSVAKALDAITKAVSGKIK